VALNRGHLLKAHEWFILVVLFLIGLGLEILTIPKYYWWEP